MSSFRLSRRSAIVAPWFFLGAFCAAMPASAQTKEELDRARHEFQEGVALSAANNCAAALLKFRSVAKVKLTAQVAFNMAECEERIGKLAAALGDFRVAAHIAGDDKKAKDVIAKVGDRVAALEARVPRLVIQRGKGAETAVIELDGAELGTNQIGVEVPVDPGPHIIVGKVEGKEYSRDSVTLAERESKTLSVSIDLPKPKVEKPAETPPDEPPPPPPRSRVPGIVVTAAGAASIGVGVVFLVLRQGSLDKLDTLCGKGSTDCPPSAKPEADSGRMFTGLAEVTLGVGLAAAVTGIVLIATSGPKPKPKSSGSLAGFYWAPAASGASVGGASFGGRF